jgi:hypothetical protein
VLGDESGAALILIATGIFALVGFGALSVDVVDVGYLFAAQNAPQASADAAAMAGARDIGVGGTPVATATSYSSVTASPVNKNNDPSFTVTWASGYPLLKCFSNIGSTCTTNQTPATSANGIEVRQLATVPLFFGRIFGISSVQISANAVALAAGGVPHPLNVMFIVDTTGSMSGTPINNALTGFRTLLGQLWPCPSNLATCGTVTNGNVANPVDEAALMVFPPIRRPARLARAPSVRSKPSPLRIRLQHQPSS